MKLIQVLLTMITLAAAGLHPYDLRSLQNSDNPELYSMLEELLNGKHIPNLQDYVKEPFVSDPKKFEKLNKEDIILDENVFRNLDNEMTKRPLKAETNEQRIFDRPIAQKENAEDNLMTGLLRDANEPKQTIRLDIPGYTVRNINGQPKLVKQTELLRGNNNDMFSKSETSSKTIKSELIEPDSDSPANQEQKFALLNLYIKRGLTIPQLENGNIDWTTIVKKLKENTSTEENSSESNEEENSPSSSLNEKLLKIIQKVKNSVLQLPTVDIGNIDLRHLIKKESSEENYNDETKSKSSHKLDVLKNYLKSGGSIPFVAASKPIWDGFLNTITQKKLKMPTTENMAEDFLKNYGNQYQMELLKTNHILKKSAPKLQDDNINWSAISNALQMKNIPIKEEKIKTETPVTNADNFVVNFESLGVKDLLAIIKDLSKPGMTREQIVKYLHEKQKDIESKTEKPAQIKNIANDDPYPVWDFNDQASFNEDQSENRKKKRGCNQKCSFAPYTLELPSKI